MKKNDYDVRKIVREWLEEHGYDGLFCEDCGCKNDDLIPCDMPSHHCRPGQFQEITKEMYDEGYDFCIGAKDESEKNNEG